MSASLTDYAQYDKATIFVASTAELNSAVRNLAENGGGTVKVDPNGGPYDLNVNGVGSSNSPVLIESDGGTPLFESVSIKNSEFIALSGVRVDTSHMAGRKTWESDLQITNSEHIEIADSTFVGSAEGYLSEGGNGTPASGTQGATGVSISGSNDILLADNTITNYFYGVKAKDTVGLEFTNNEVTQFQGDGFQGNGLQKTEITHNHIHTPLGSTQSLVHTDFIQIHMSGSKLQNSDIEIAHNLLDSADGGNAQGIFMGDGGTGGRSKDISVHDNVIHSALPNGIGLNSIDGLEVYNNTVLWNEASYIEARPGADLDSWDARILINNSKNLTLEDNVASWMRVNGVHQDNGGYQIQYGNPNASNHVDKHFADVNGSGTSYDLSMLSSSPLYGKDGSSLSWDGFQPSESAPAPADSAPTPVADAPVVEETVLAATVEAPPPEVTLYLVDTETDTFLGELQEGDTLDSAYLGSSTISVVADVTGDVGSVTLSLGDWSQTENVAPYALFGDTDGDFWDAQDPAFAEAGSYTLKVEMFEGRGGIGKIAETSTTFAVEEAEAEPVPAETAPDPVPEPLPEKDPVAVIEDTVPEIPEVPETAPEPASAPVVAPAPAAVADPVEAETDPAKDAEPSADPAVSTAPEGDAETPVDETVVFATVEEEADPPATSTEEEDVESLLARILDVIMSLFGGGDDDEDTATVMFSRTSEVALDEIVPMVEGLEEIADLDDQDDMSATDLAA